MLLTLPAAGIDLLPARHHTAAAPPERWARWWTSPIARVDYGAAATIDPWHEAFIPAERGLTGALRPALAWGGTSRDAAIDAARALARLTVQLQLEVGGQLRTVEISPAIAVLRDARAGAYWLAPLRTTIRSGEEWVEAPHSIDGPAFEGGSQGRRGARVLSATRDMVAVVGRDTVLTPAEWADAPHDSRLGATS